MPISDAEIFVAKRGQKWHFTHIRRTWPQYERYDDLDLVLKYLGQTSFSRISDPDFLFDPLYIMGSISNRYGACVGQNTTRTVTFTLLASQLDMTVPE